MTDENAANAMPYAIASVEERYAGEYATYLLTSKAPLVRIRVAL